MLSQYNIHYYCHAQFTNFFQCAIFYLAVRKEKRLIRTCANASEPEECVWTTGGDRRGVFSGVTCSCKSNWCNGGMKNGQLQLGFVTVAHAVLVLYLNI